MTSKEEKRRKAAFKKRRFRPWVIVFLSLFGALLAAAAIWKNAWDPAKPPVVVEPKFETTIEPSKLVSIRELDLLVSQLESSYFQAPTPGRVEILQHLYQCGQQMIKVGKTEADLQKGKKTVLHSLVLLATLKWAQQIEPGDTREILRAVTEQYKNDSNVEMARDVQTALILLTGYEMMDEPASDERAEAFKQAVGNAVSKFPVDIEIAKTIDVILEHFQSKNEDWSAMPGLIEHIGLVYADCKEPFIQRWIGSLPDRVVFHRHQLDRLLAQCEASVDAAFDELIEAVPKILADGLSNSGVIRLMSVANGLERMARYSYSHKVYSLLSTWSSNLGNAEELKRLREACDNGIKRLELIGQKLILDCKDVSGKSLVPAAYLGHPTLVLFVSGNDDLTETKATLAELRSLGRQGIMVVLVCLEMDSKTATSQFTDAEMSRLALVIDPQRTGPIYRQCPVEMTPYAVILDKESRVMKVSVPNVFIETELEGLLFSKQPASTGSN